MLNFDPSKCKRECTWGIKVYVGRYKDICESSGDKVIDQFLCDTDCERLRNFMTCYLQTLGVASVFDFLGRLADI